MPIKLNKKLFLLSAVLVLSPSVLVRPGTGQELDDQRDIQAKEIVRPRRPGRRTTSTRRDQYSAPKQFPLWPPPKSMTHLNVGMTLWRVRVATEAESKDSKVAKEWMSWDQKDYEVVVTRMSDAEPIPDQDLIQITIEYLANQDQRYSNRAGYLYVINREQFPDGSLRNARLIFPTLMTYGGDNRVLPGKTVTLPDPKRPFIITRGVSGQPQRSEVYTIILSPVPLDDELPQPLGNKAIQLTPQLVTRWEQRWGAREVRADLKGSLGQSRTQRELEANGDTDETRGTKDSAEDLTQDDSVPQTVFRSVVRPGVGMLFTVKIPFAGGTGKQ
jgi:hypothetical protein